MRIGLNAITFQPGGMGGMETYFRNLLAGLQGIDRENYYTLLCAERHAGQFPLYNDCFRTRHVNFAKPSFNWLIRGIVRNTLGPDILDWKMRRLDLDVIHHPFNVLTPAGTGIPSVLTFWDMQHEFFPEFFNPVELRKRRRAYRASAEGATRIMVAAEFTKQCLMERYGIDGDKIEVIQTGYGPEYRVIDDSTHLDRIRRKYGLSRPFLFYPAATWPHKNHSALLAALRIMAERRSFDGELVLTGIAMQSHGAIMAEIGRLGLGDVVKVLGYIPADELPGIYNLARLMVFPSLFEGFGIPLVEAMASGCPVACSNVTSLPEVVGDAGELFDPRSPEEIAEKVYALWTDVERLSGMRGLGLERAMRFHWNETAQRTLNVYRKAAGDQ